VESIAIVARLKPGTEERARELAIREPGVAQEPGVSRVSVFLSPGEAVFVLEGDSPDESFRKFLDNPVNSTMLAPWLPLFDGPLHRAPELAHWDLPTG
jgi:hypothetical protein